MLTTLLIVLLAVVQGQPPATPSGPAVGPVVSVREIEVPSEPGKTIRCTITVPPPPHDPSKPIPVLIAFPPGPQTDQMAASINAFYRRATLARGWALVTPRPPQTAGQTFFSKPELLDLLLADLDTAIVAQGNVYFVTGNSNGGRSALAFAVRHPTRTAAVAGHPGTLPKLPPSADDLASLRNLPVRLWCGGDDTVNWLDAGRILVEAAKKDPALDVRFTVLPGEGHILRSLDPETILDELENARTAPKPAPGVGKPGEPATPTAATTQLTREQLDCLATLNALHAAATKADFDAYFALYTHDAVFIGTDANERWTIERFKAYARPHFSPKPNGQQGGWAYTPWQSAGARNVTIDTAGTTAFFDELLDSASYGTTRGTGVLRKTDGGWKVAQYSLSIPIPNPLAKRVAAMVKSEETKKK